MKKTIVTILLATGAFAMQAQTITESDKKFAKMVAEDGMKQIKLSQLAETRATSAECKRLAENIINDHQEINDELKKWASSKNVTLPSGLSNEGQKDYDKLNKAKQSDFDMEYTKCIAKDQKKLVSDFKKQADKGDDSELKSWASRTVPTLEENLKMAEDMVDMLKKKDKVSTK